VVTVSLKTVLSQFFDFFVCYYIFAKTISKRGTVHKIVFGFVAAMFVCSVFGAIEAYRGWSVISIFPAIGHRFSNFGGLVSDRGIRVRSTFGHPILFGGALAMSIPLALSLLTLSRTIVRKAFLWICVALMFLNIYKTGSRGPWLALVMTLVLILLFGTGQIRRYVVVLVLLSATVLLVRPGVWETIVNLYGATMDSESAQGASYEWRYALYRITFEHLDEHPDRAIWGYGPESFFYLGWQGQFQGSTVAFESCDSSVAALLAETGYIGCFLVVFLLGKAALVTFLECRKLPSPSNGLLLAFFVNLCTFCFLMTNVAIFGWGQQNYLLWIVIAMAMIYPVVTQDDAIEPADFGPVNSHSQLVGTSRYQPS
jgi:hypothetical protein